jgi:hypothetical protein
VRRSTTRGTSLATCKLGTRETHYTCQKRHESVSTPKMPEGVTGTDMRYAPGHVHTHDLKCASSQERMLLESRRHQRHQRRHTVGRQI